MRGSADTARIHDATRRLAFLDRDIVRRNQTLEMGLEFSSNFSLSEMRAVRGLFLGMVFGRIFSQPILSSSSVAAFRGSNSDSTARSTSFSCNFSKYQPGFSFRG
jgi:hypothetical protein